MRLFTILTLSIFLSACMTKIDVDLIVHNANIYTVDETVSVQQAMAIQGESIIEIGPEHQILNKYSAS